VAVTPSYYFLVTHPLISYQNPRNVTNTVILTKFKICQITFGGHPIQSTVKQTCPQPAGHSTFSMFSTRICHGTTTPFWSSLPVLLSDAMVMSLSVVQLTSNGDEFKTVRCTKKRSNVFSLCGGRLLTITHEPIISNIEAHMHGTSLGPFHTNNI
jgi:hypothetical protein